MSREPTIEALTGRTANGAALAGDGRAMLRTRLQEAVERGAISPGKVVRVSVSVDPIAPLDWLAAQPTGFKFYWCGRGEESAWATAGVADEVDGVTAMDTLRQRLSTLPSNSSARYVGGMSFQDGARSNEMWGQFGSARFVLPRFELRASKDRTTLSVNLFIPEKGPPNIERLLEDLAEPRPFRTHIPLPVDRADEPTSEGWCRAVDDVLTDIRRGALRKVVLARHTSFRFDEAIDPFALVARLQTATPNSFHFLLQPSGRDTLLGASPERLFSWENGEVSTEAVAGTRPRGRTTLHDAELRDELASSAKDAREHQFVVDHLRETLSACCADVDVEPTGMMELTSKWHLRTRVTARARPGQSPLDVLARLHPTPAVGGTPAGLAAERIRTAEPFGRGWYAGPLGWIGKDSADFAVAIRCGLVRQRGDAAVLDLFSGAGIVDGSDPEAELAEIENKIVDFTRVLGLED